MKYSVLDSYSYKIEVDRSLFIGYLFPLRDVKDFKSLHHQVRKEHPKATHICYAYKTSQHQKFFDDGEPSKTAGYPILDTIQRYHLDEVVIFVVRYFGGIKLGTGGLMRAYTQAAEQVIPAKKLYRVVSMHEYELHFHLSLVEPLERFIKEHAVLVLNKAFDLQAAYRIASETDITASLIELTNNQIVINHLGSNIHYLQ
jgi:uncharacterized YigZ family protein